MNFIYDFDEAAKNNNDKYIFRNVIFDPYNSANNNFIFRKESTKSISKTIILYIKNNVRVRFSDNDILDMILKIEENDVVGKLVEALKSAYIDKLDKTIMKMGNQDYVIIKLPEIQYEKIITSRKDIDITFEDLYVLINLILAKDIAATKVIGKINFLKRTLSKYILVIGKYYFNGQKENEFFNCLSVKYSGDFYKDFEIGKYAQDNIKKVVEYKKFESYNII